MSARENREREREWERERARGVSLSLFLINHLFEKTSPLSLFARAKERERERKRERHAETRSQKKIKTSALTLVACRTALSSLPEMLSPWWLLVLLLLLCVWHLFLFCFYISEALLSKSAKIRYETLNTEILIFSRIKSFTTHKKRFCIRKETKTNN